MRCDPSADEAARLLAAGADLVAVIAEVPAATLHVEAAVAGGDEDAFLLETAAGPGRYSFAGVAPSRVVESPPGESRDVLTEVAQLTGGALAPPAVELPFLGGAVGHLSFELATAYERLPVAPADPLRLPRARLGIYDCIAALDHEGGRAHLVGILHAGDDYAAVVARMEELAQRLSQAPQPRGGDEGELPGDLDSVASMSRNAFAAAVERSREYILAGDIFQVQIARRFSVPFGAHPLTLYRHLREINPSPYMFCLRSPQAAIIGASPEMLVRVRDRHITYHPIAGTRRRGRTDADDAAMEAELRGSEKERAEHLMLVDLGRNDVGRCAAVGSVAVTELMEVERYSHVMHLVSTVEAECAAPVQSIDVLRSCFPAGTVTGAPKLRAMEIIAELEPVERGAYAGAAGYIGYGGNLDMAIALRTIVLRDGVAHLQAAAGIVADSTVEEETREIDNKVAALVAAMRRSGGR